MERGSFSPMCDFNGLLCKKRRTKRDLLSQRLTFNGYFWIKSYKIKPREVIPRGLLNLLYYPMCDFTGIWEKWHPIGILLASWKAFLQKSNPIKSRVSRPLLSLKDAWSGTWSDNAGYPLIVSIYHYFSYCSKCR